MVKGRAVIVEGPVAPSASPRLGALTRRLSLRYLGPDGPTTPSGPSIARRRGVSNCNYRRGATRDTGRASIEVGVARLRTVTGLERIATLLAINSEQGERILDRDRPHPAGCTPSHSAGRRRPPERRSG